jgi:cytochrome P450
MTTESIGLPAVMVPVDGLTSPEARLNPFSFYSRMRILTPVRFDETRRTWDVFSYHDVHHVLTHHQLFSSERPKTGPVLLGSIIGTNPPRHTKLRAIVSSAFTPKMVQGLAPRIESIVDSLLKHNLFKGQMEFVHDFAVPLPILVIAELLGVPSSDHALFKRWSDVIAKGAADNTQTAAEMLLQEKEHAKVELDDYFRILLRDRQIHPQDDLISRLVQAEVDGEKLSEEEVLEFCILLLAAGNETTTNLLTNAVRRYVEDYGLQDQLRHNPNLIQSSTEEVLRYYSPIQATNRYARDDVLLGEQKISAGDQLVAWIGSANRDDTVFDNAEDFVPDRQPNRHLAFGHGIHFCLGAPLARLEAEIALPALLRSTEEMRMMAGRGLKPILSSFVYGVSELSIQFIPRES